MLMRPQSTLPHLVYDNSRPTLNLVIKAIGVVHIYILFIAQQVCRIFKLVSIISYLDSMRSGLCHQNMEPVSSRSHSKYIVLLGLYHQGNTLLGNQTPNMDFPYVKQSIVRAHVKVSNLGPPTGYSFEKIPNKIPCVNNFPLFLTPLNFELQLKNYHCASNSHHDNLMNFILTWNRKSYITYYTYSLPNKPRLSPVYPTQLKWTYQIKVAGGFYQSICTW